MYVLIFKIRHVAFGYIVGEGSFSTLAKIEAVGTEHGEPKKEVRITESGQLYPHG
jgi:hypothetical protein